MELKVKHAIIKLNKEGIILEEEKFYNKDWFMWLMFVLFIPAGIALMWKNRRYNTLIRSIVSAVYLFLFICEYTAITTGNISGMITLICVFVLIPYVITHWKQLFKKNVPYSTINKDNTNCNPKQTHRQKSAGLAIIGVILMALGIYTLNNSYKNSKQNVSPNKSNTAQVSTSDANSNKGATTAPTKAEQPKDDSSIKEGMYKAGTDIQAGEYVIIANDDTGAGYIQITKDSTGTLNSIIANENISGRTYVTVNDGEYLTVKDAKTYPLDKAPKVDTSSGTLSDGMYKAGVDIQPGEYKVNSPGDGYVEVATNSRHTVNGIISNDNFSGDKYVSVQNGQYLKISHATLTLK